MPRVILNASPWERVHKYSHVDYKTTVDNSSRPFQLWINHSTKNKRLKMKTRLFILSLLSCLIPVTVIWSQDVLLIKGSDTLINLVQTLSEAYMEKNPDAAIAVTGGGSGVGIASLIADRVQIANSSRKMKETEYAAVRNFIAFELGSEGQKIVEEMGFYPASGKYLEQNKNAGF